MMQWWQRLDKSISLNPQPNRFMQLATVQNDGSPANRTVVYRGRNNDHDILMISDARSQKFSQLLVNPKAEICWYFYDSREQFRFSGEIHCLLPNEGNDQDKDELLRIWQNLSSNAQKQYEWPNPGIPISSDEELKQIANNALSTDDHPNSNPPLHFCVLKMHVMSIDYLQLANPIHKHIQYDYDKSTKEWQGCLLTP